MKAGDLVVMPKAVLANILRNNLGVGLIVNDAIFKNRIGVMWSDGKGKVDYEPVKWLEVISEGR